MFNGDNMENIKIYTDTITLVQFLKVAGVIQTGGILKAYLEDNLVYVNGELEYRKKRQLKDGFVVKIVDMGEYKVEVDKTIAK